MLQSKIFKNKYYRLTSAFKVKNEAWMITEYSGNRNLSNYLEDRHGKAMREVEARFFILQLLACINYFHQKGIIHGNLSNTNVLISEAYDQYEFSDEFYSSDGDKK